MDRMVNIHEAVTDRTRSQIGFRSWSSIKFYASKEGRYLCVINQLHLWIQSIRCGDDYNDDYDADDDDDDDDDDDANVVARSWTTALEGFKHLTATTQLLSPRLLRRCSHRNFPASSSSSSSSSSSLTSSSSSSSSSSSPPSLILLLLILFFNYNSSFTLMILSALRI